MTHHAVLRSSASAVLSSTVQTLTKLFLCLEQRLLHSEPKTTGDMLLTALAGVPNK